MTPGISLVPSYEKQTHSVPSTAAARAVPV
jgi:hypothetical protein